MCDVCVVCGVQCSHPQRVMLVPIIRSVFSIVCVVVSIAVAHNQTKLGNVTTSPAPHSVPRC